MLAEPFVREPSCRGGVLVLVLVLVLVAITVATMANTRISPMWLVALGALVGAFGLV